jgi:hypothetical protein
MSYKDSADVSGLSESDTIKVQQEGGFTKNTASQGARSQGYELLYEETGRHRVVINTGSKTSSSAITVDRKDSSTAGREHINRLLRQCQSSAEEMLSTDDPIEVSNEAHVLLETMDELWKWRHSREENWGDLLNMLQGAMYNQQFETFPRIRKEAMARIFQDCFTKKTVTKQDFDRAIQFLVSAGLDPWSGISGSVE